MLALVSSQFKPTHRERSIVNKFNYKCSPLNPQSVYSTLLLPNSILGPPLPNVLNTSLSSGIVPSAFNVAMIKPPLRKGDPDVLNYYRPISDLPFLKFWTEQLQSNEVLISSAMVFSNNYKLVSGDQTSLNHL